MERGNRRLTLYDQMSEADDGRVQAGVTINGVVVAEKRAAASTATYAQLSNRTLLDIIKDDEPNSGRSSPGHRDKRSWKSFRDRLRLKRAGATWTSSVAIPTSDVHIPVQNRRSLMSRRNSVRFDTVSSSNFSLDATHSNGPSDFGTTTDPSSNRPQISRRSSSRFSPNALLQPDPTESNDSSEGIQGTADIARVRSFRPQMSRHNSTRYSPATATATDENYTDPSREGTRRLSVALAEERALSAREAAAAQVAAEAAAAAEAETRGEEEGQEGGSEAATQPIRMSLMDLLEETDRQMGVEGSRYAMGDEGEEEEEEEEDEEEAAKGGGGGAGAGGGEFNCCVCMVRHKGSAFIPCGHTFCRLCSRELWVSRGNCPLCNGFILEILDIF